MRINSFLIMFPLIFSRKKISTTFKQFSSERCSAILRSFCVILLVLHFKEKKINPIFKYTDVLNKVHSPWFSPTKYSEPIQDAGIMAQRMSPKILKIRFLNTFFMLNRTKNQTWRINDIQYSPFKNLWKKIISRHFQLVRISYQKLDFYIISRFSAVFIINNLNASRYKSGTMNTNSLLGLSINRSDKKKPQH
jgi:hypothetical protein